FRSKQVRTQDSTRPLFNETEAGAILSNPARRISRSLFLASVPLHYTSVVISRTYVCYPVSPQFSSVLNRVPLRLRVVPKSRVAIATQPNHRSGLKKRNPVVGA